MNKLVIAISVIAVVAIVYFAIAQNFVMAAITKGEPNTITGSKLGSMQNMTPSKVSFDYALKHVQAYSIVGAYDKCLEGKIGDPNYIAANYPSLQSWCDFIISTSAPVTNGVLTVEQAKSGQIPFNEVVTFDAVVKRGNSLPIAPIFSPDWPHTTDYLQSRLCDATIDKLSSATYSSDQVTTFKATFTPMEYTIEPIC